MSSATNASPDLITYPPFLPNSMWIFLYSFCCKRIFLPFSFVFSKNCSTSRWIFNMLMREVELNIFLLEKFSIWDNRETVYLSAIEKLQLNFKNYLVPGCFEWPMEIAICSFVCDIQYWTILRVKRYMKHYPGNFLWIFFINKQKHRLYLYFYGYTVKIFLVWIFKDERYFYIDHLHSGQRKPF